MRATTILCRPPYFYPRPPRGGRRFDASEHITWYLFLSTPSARRATTSAGGTYTASTISIHALREEGDLCQQRGAGRHPGISIHALREEGDTDRLCRSMSPSDFYPRPPRGGRQETWEHLC